MSEMTDWQERAVLAMYDVRGIQNYVFKTGKVKDARGASAIVENIIYEALAYAVKGENVTKELEWFDDRGVRNLQSEQDYQDVQVLFIGGGNATVLYRDRELCVRINKKMSKYVLEHTYSLQLAIEVTEKTNSYADDYKRLQSSMVWTKARMPDTKPLGTLPVMKMELQTGYPLEITRTINGKVTELGRETWRKKEKADQLARADAADSVEKRFDQYITKKGVDSDLAVVHVDGNNMGLRIRKLIENEKNYVTAINKMRHISYNISASYQSVFDKMAHIFNEKGNIEGKENQNFVLKILAAGDDITYVCNAGVAIATVEYYCRGIAKCSMNKNIEEGLAEEDSVLKYGFSVCAGIAYFTSHFPFHIAYAVAEECCGSAKSYAKKHADGERIGNFLDFQICKNIQAQNIERIRRREYETRTGEQLIQRPYYVSVGDQRAYRVFEDQIPDQKKLSSLKRNICYFQDQENIPRSIAKELRNIYTDGQQPVRIFADFLKSRDHKMPNGTFEMYEDDMDPVTAKWYDALELMDDYVEVRIDE